jgi:pimeloyl-ACP methyl ester carboxylesterase
MACQAGQVGGQCPNRSRGLSERLAEISVPALVLHGTADDTYPESEGQAIADGIAQSEPLVRIEGGTQFLSNSDPDLATPLCPRFSRGIPKAHERSLEA